MARHATRTTLSTVCTTFSTVTRIPFSLVHRYGEIAPPLADNWASTSSILERKVSTVPHLFSGAGP